MSENTKIEWCDHTFNPWEGCQKVGPGCDHCYAETRNARFGGGIAPNWGSGAPRRRTSASNWVKPLRWNLEAAVFAEKHGRKQRVFCASLADVFDNAVDPQWRLDLFDLIDKTPNLDWLLLTKRVGNVTVMLSDMGRETLPPHVWLGATVVNQEEANRDIPSLLVAPAVIRFLSIEPLLGPVNLRELATMRFRGAERLDALTGRLEGMFGDYCPTRLPPLNWIIAGGESGPGARPMHPDWVRYIRDQCDVAGVPFLFKQWGEWAPTIIDLPSGFIALNGQHWSPLDDDRIEPGIAWISHVGKKLAGRILDGQLHDGFPA